MWQCMLGACKSAILLNMKYGAFSDKSVRLIGTMFGEYCDLTFYVEFTVEIQVIHFEKKNTYKMLP